MLFRQLNPHVRRICQRIFFASFLECGLSVLEKHLEVGLVPFTGLGRGLVRVGLAAEGVVSGSTLVAGAVRLTTGLTPDEGIGKLETSVSGGADTETGAVDIAPVTPFLTETSDGVSASVDDGVLGETSSL